MMTIIKNVLAYVAIELAVAGLVALACFIFDGHVEVGGLFTRMYVALCTMWNILVAVVCFTEEVDE